jgi:hypothetical protein
MIKDELMLILDTKTDIRNALRDKGLTPSDTFSDYPDEIRKLEKAQSGFEVRYFDFDGTILKTEYVEQGQDSTPPSVPTHEFLTFQEWNNDFTNIQHDMDIGATYITSDGKTRAVVNLSTVVIPELPTDSTFTNYSYYYMVNTSQQTYYSSMGSTRLIATNSEPYLSGTNGVYFPATHHQWTLNATTNTWNTPTTAGSQTRYTYEKWFLSNAPIYTNSGKTVIAFEPFVLENFTIKPSPELHFWKSNTDPLLIEWGDETSDTYTESGFVVANHIYNNDGIYTIKMSIPEGIGTYRLGNATGSSFSPVVKQYLRGYSGLQELYIGEKVTHYYSGSLEATILTKLTMPSVDFLQTYPYGGRIGVSSLKYLTVPRLFSAMPNLSGGNGMRHISFPMKSMGLPHSYLGGLGADKLILPLFSGTAESAFSGSYTRKVIWTGGPMGLRCFQNCKQLREFEMRGGSVGTEALYGLTNLEKITVRSGVTSFGQMDWYETVLVEKVDLPTTVSFIPGYIGSVRLIELIVRRTTPPTMSIATAIRGNTDLKIYVPDASVDAYKTATNWVAYAERIFPLSELEV